MARTDGDSWSITESVGTTALAVAAARAADTESAEPLIDDPFARMFLDAAGPGSWSMWSPSGLPPEVVAATPELPTQMQVMVDYLAVRTVFFDEFFTDAVRSGVRQAVILAAGLDARAWRLPWPNGTTVYELDLPKVLEFKTTTLAGHGVSPTAHRVGVAVDLRDDWPAALRAAGFDDTVPSVWSAEGLLPFLPSTAQDLLFERVQELSAPGSRIAVEAMGPGFGDPAMIARQQEMMGRFREAVGQLPDAGDMPDFDDLWYLEDRADVADWLRGHGWRTTVITSDELKTRCGRPAPAGFDDPMPPSVFVSAERG